MDKRTVYIILGTLVIFYLVSRKTNPELSSELHARAVAIWTGKSPSANGGDADAAFAPWDKHRQEIFAARVKESKRRALAKYPALAVADSEMNIRFLYRYQWMVKENSPRLHAPNWPEMLADDCALAAQPAAKINMTKPHAANASVAAR